MKSLRSWCLAALAAVLVVSAGVVAPETVAAQAVPMQAGAPGTAAVAQGLLQYEQAVNWDVVSRRWIARRPAWQAEVRAASSPSVVAAHAVELETAMGWDAMAPTWRQNRAPWVAQAGAAATAAQVAQVLIALETATGWNAVSVAWRTQRTGWVASMQAVR